MKMLTCFPHLLSPSPACPRTPCLFVPFPISTRDPLPLEGGLETYSPVSSLGCFLSKPYSLQTSRSQRFGFAVLWARGTWLGNGGPSALAGEGKASSSEDAGVPHPAVLTSPGPRPRGGNQDPRPSLRHELVHTLPAASPLLLPGQSGLKEPAGTEKHCKLRRKSNKELEDFHGAQALDGGRRHQRTKKAEGQPGGTCGCRAQASFCLV
ncbi:uncharacterized protein LOC102164776 isoform X2 [Sus scrofa]|uniref:uncharacterized protein LOC102164776 isoform X2 n=1 Tax=Sus scrofa TaxID=9823 RepID=UPI000A2B97AF|nr:uncharacterized protein LOC102164776 isoform X2 [Sus scrofa]